MVSNNLHNEKKKLKSGKKRKRQAMVEKTKPGDPSSTDSDDNSPKKAKSDEGIYSAANFLKIPAQTLARSGLNVIFIREDCS